MTTAKDKAAALRLAAEILNEEADTVGQARVTLMLREYAERFEREHVRSTAKPMDQITSATRTGHHLYGPDAEGKFWKVAEFSIPVGGTYRRPEHTIKLVEVPM